MHLIEPPVTLLNDASLFLDFDGTLVELASMPDAIEVEDELLGQLFSLQAMLGGRVALISGRAVDDIRPRLGRLKLAIGGSHGLERSLPDGSCLSPPPPPGIGQAVADLKRLEAEHPGVHIEEKPAGVAVHYRLAPLAEAACHDAAERAATAIGLALQHGKMVVELKPADVDKGSALRSFMALPLFADTRPVFVGDDLTDEHAFVAVREYDGAGVLVGPERPTAAIYRLENVSAVRSWLRAASEALQ